MHGSGLNRIQRDSLDIKKCQLIKIVVYLCGSPVYTASRLEI